MSYESTLVNRSLCLNILIGMFLGYIVHDAIQPTAVGEVLDKIALPSDLLVKSNQSAVAQKSGSA